jgi:hypothetical protein
MGNTLTTHHIHCNHCHADFDAAVVPDRCVNCASRDIEATAHTEGLPDLWRMLGTVPLVDQFSVPFKPVPLFTAAQVVEKIRERAPLYSYGVTLEELCEMVARYLE